MQACISLSESFRAGSQTLQISANLPDFLEAAFSYYPSMGQKQSYIQQQHL
jgi:hypothetical protein